VYYPASSDRIFSFHGICGHPPRGEKLQYSYELHEIVATEEAFRTIWKQNALLSSTMRQTLEAAGEMVHNSLIFATDRVAGDDQYVFLTVAEPHSVGSRGYGFVFDARQLIEAGAVIGLNDLGTFFYGRVAEKIEVPDRNDLSTWSCEQIETFQDRIKPVQNVWRISGQKALDWLDWVKGERVDNPVSAKTLRIAANKVANVGEHNIEWIAQDRRSARNAELLVPKSLFLDTVVGVLFRKNWVEIEDFVEAYGFPGTDPPQALEPWQAHMLESYGHPCRCKRCGNWMLHDPLHIPERSSMWSSIWHDRMKVPGVESPIMIMRCNSCDAAFGHRGDGMSFFNDPFTDEEYLGQYSDLEHVPYRW